MSETLENNQYNFKIILIGDSSVGKTSIINKYSNKGFNEIFSCTIGVDFLVKDVEISGQKIRLSIWDTAGQEKYKAVNRSYYWGSDACFLIFDLTSKQSFDNLDGWYKEFCENSEKSSQDNIVILGNKSDLDKREVNDKDINEFIDEKNLKYFETSAKDGKNINEFFKYIMEKLLKQYKKNNIKGKNIEQNEFRESLAKRKIQNDITSKEKNNKCC